MEKQAKKGILIALDGLDGSGKETQTRLLEEALKAKGIPCRSVGRTLDDSFIILDEAQNTTPEQMKMFLTRLGFRSKIVVTGDVTQIDLPGGVKSGLKDAVSILSDVEDPINVYAISSNVIFISVTITCKNNTNKSTGIK